jgi:NAD(P)H dehydrogenase (quinone)
MLPQLCQAVASRRSGRSFGLNATVALIVGLVPGPLRAAPHAAPDSASVLVAYYSLTGHTEAMARAAADAAAAVPGVVVRTMSVADVTTSDVEWADGLVVGSPTHWANLPPAVAEFVAQWPFLGGKVAGAIATAGNPGGGSEHVLQSLIAAFLNHGAEVVGPVFEEEGGFRYGWMGAAALTGPADPGVDEVELDGARRLGRRVAELVSSRNSTSR